MFYSTHKNEILDTTHFRTLFNCLKMLNIKCVQEYQNISNPIGKNLVCCRNIPLSSARFFPKQNDPKTVLSMNTQEIKSLFLNARQNFRQQFSREEE